MRDVLTVDLPELEDMPTKLAAVPLRVLKLSVKELPMAQLVKFSGYSQRRSKVTGQVGNEYLISVRVDRSAWESMDFRGLASVEVTASLAQFDLKRDQLRSGYFKENAPHST